MFDLAIFQHVDGPKPTGVEFTAVPVIRRRDKNGVESIEMLGVRFTGRTADEARTKAEAQFAADRARAERRDASLREAAAKRAANREVA